MNILHGKNHDNHDFHCDKCYCKQKKEKIIIIKKKGKEGEEIKRKKEVSDIHSSPTDPDFQDGEENRCKIDEVKIKPLSDYGSVQLAYLQLLECFHHQQ